VGHQPMNREQRRAAARRARRMAAVGSAGVLVASGVSMVTGTLVDRAGAATTITVTNLNATGPNSLYDAMNNAVSGDTIDFQAGLTGTITLSKNLPTISQNISIVGPGPGVITIDGQDKYHPFEFEQAGAASISGLTITNGFSNGVNNDNSGGAIGVYAYGRHMASMTISHMVITSSASQNDGAAIWCHGGYSYRAHSAGYVDALTITDTVITGNHSNSGGGGLYSDSCTNVTIANTTISGNTAAGNGGGMYVDDGALEVRNTTVSGNTGRYGGGVFVNDYQFAFENSTISGNHATKNGGGIEQYDGALSLVQTTVTANTAAGNGAGLYAENLGFTVRPSATRGDDRTKREATEHSKENAKAKLGTQQATDELVLTGTILAGNPGVDLQGDGSAGQISSQNSLIGTVDPATVVHDLGGTLLGVNPMLGPLANNGGPTQTHALLAGSPAINTGPNPVPTFTGNQFDQRGPGFARVIGGRVDIGAFEAPLVARFTG